jgi:ABC-type amino acid transport substrate-binding protein
MSGFRERPSVGRLIGIVLSAFLSLGSLPAIAQPPTTNAGSRLEAIRARGALQVCIWPDYFSISFRNPRNGQLEGIDIDMAGALARRLGVSLTLVDTSFADFMNKLEAGACDIAMFGVGVTPARAARVEFSDPYLISRVYGVVLNAAESRPGFATKI